MDKLTEFFKKFEPQADRIVAGASSVPSLRQTLAENDLVQSLAERIRDGGRVAELALFLRLTKVVEHEHKEGFRHPSDAAITVYLHVLSETASTYSGAAESFVRRIAGAFWANMVLDDPLQHRTVGTSCLDVGLSVAQYHAVMRDDSQSETWQRDADLQPHWEDLERHSRLGLQIHAVGESDQNTIKVRWGGSNLVEVEDSAPVLLKHTSGVVQA